MADNISIELTRDQALVLFEWLANVNANGQLSVHIDHAEQRVLWDLEASLESALPEILSDNYSQFVDAARVRVEDM